MDSAVKRPQYDPTRSVFIGNLPFVVDVRFQPVFVQLCSAASGSLIRTVPPTIQPSLALSASWRQACLHVLRSIEVLLQCPCLLKPVNKADSFVCAD